MFVVKASIKPQLNLGLGAMCVFETLADLCMVGSVLGLCAGNMILWEFLGITGSAPSLRRRASGYPLSMLLS